MKSTQGTEVGSRTWVPPKIQGLNRVDHHFPLSKWLALVKSSLLVARNQQQLLAQAAPRQLDPFRGHLSWTSSEVMV